MTAFLLEDSAVQVAGTDKANIVVVVLQPYLMRGCVLDFHVEDVFEIL